MGEPRRRVVCFAVVVLMAELAALALSPGAITPWLNAGWWPMPMVLLGFVLSEPLVFHIEARNEEVSFSPSDLPLAVGLLTIAPLHLVAIRIVGAGLGLLIWRRPPSFKLGLNLTSFSAEVIVAGALFRLLTRGTAPTSLVVWPCLGLALFCGLLTGGLIIGNAISFFEADRRARLTRELRHSYLFYLPGAVLGASTAYPITIDRWLALVFLLPAPTVWLVLRSHGHLMHRYTDLTQIHEFSSAVSRSNHLHEIADIAAREIATTLRAGSVALSVWDSSGRSVQISHGDPDLARNLPAGPDDPAWAAVLAASEPSVLHAGDQHPAAAWLDRSGTGELVAAPLCHDDHRIGLLVVADRQGAAASFDRNDLDRLGPITHQLAVALRKAQLHLAVQHEATHDRLTGLPNRSYFEAWFEQQHGLRSASGFSLLMLDLDRFKEVNDTHGHQAGDELLVQAAQRIIQRIDQRTAGQLGPTAMACRLGGDEFAILVPTTDPATVRRLADEITDALAQPFPLTMATVTIGVSIGTAEARHTGWDTSSVLHEADLDMYHNKQQRRLVASPAANAPDPAGHSPN